jgi:cytochrome oxidase Cu insertion factor (SCO1/SenC/PrrC family)
MRLEVILAAILILLPGCVSEEQIKFNGRDLDESQTYKFTLESHDGELWSLEDQRGKVVVLVFMFTRCDDTCPVTSQNVNWVKSQLSEAELEQVSFVSVTVDWRNDSPSKLENWSEDRGYDWPHLTGTQEALEMVYDTYGAGPIEQGDDSNEGYTVAHTSPTYILDSDLKGRVVWSDYDFPVDLFLEDLRTVLAI